MNKKKKYPSIEPKYLNNKQGKPVVVYLDYGVYNSIFDEINELEKKIHKIESVLKKSRQKK